MYIRSSILVCYTTARARTDRRKRGGGGSRCNIGTCRAMSLHYDYDYDYILLSRSNVCALLSLLLLLALPAHRPLKLSRGAKWEAIISSEGMCESGASQSMYHVGRYDPRSVDSQSGLLLRIILEEGVSSNVPAP